MKKLSVLLPLVVAAASVGALVASSSRSALAADEPSRLPAPEATLENPDGEAVFAGGCFWCVEAVFEPLQGVTDVVSGYAGGSEADAKYDLVSAGQTDHAEAVKIVYDPEQISYATLLHVFFSTHDPLTGNGQHPDYGTQYRPSVFYDNDDEQRVASAYISQLNGAGVFDKPVATALEPLDAFYPAEEYHQDFVEKNPDHAYVVRWSVPKQEKLKKLFPELLKGNTPSTQPAAGSGESLDPVLKTEEEWKQQLSEQEFYVLREEGTERAFSSPLNDIKKPGTFTCAGCDLPVFETKTKFESGTGWPSFYEPIKPSHVTEKPDNTMGMTRTEIECARCGGHLGHVFNDGPEPTGLRYCMNGVALAFKPAP